MIRELLLAIVLGALLGFGLTGSYFALKPSTDKPNSNIPSPTPIVDTLVNDTSPSPTPTEDISLVKIIIDSPLNESITSSSKIEIKGSTNSTALVVVQTSTRTYQTNADKNGSFAIEIDLESGANLIKLTAFDADLNQGENSILITYSTAKI